MNRTFVHDTPGAFLGARTLGLRPAPFEKGLFELAPGRLSGLLVSPVCRTLRPFRELVLSANADLPPGSSLRLSVAVRRDGRWGPWRGMGTLAAAGGASPEPGGPVDVDTLVLDRPADAFRFRVEFLRGRRGGPVLKLAAAACSDAPPSRERPQRRRRGDGAVLLDVPARSQMEEAPALRGDVCSPASLGMVLDYWGAGGLTTSRLARAVRDRRGGIYGNWLLNTAFAGRRLDAWVARLPDMASLEAQVRAGRPVVCTVAFGPGELAGAPIERTRGHLLVVRGFDGAGDVLVNDPAAPSARKAPRSYNRREFERAWLERKKGTCYLLAPRFPKLLSVAVPVADLRSVPGVVRGRRDPAQESQLLLGETVLCRGGKGGWARVGCLDQTRGGVPYEGWVRAEALGRTAMSPDLVVRGRCVDVRIEAGGRLVLPAGSLVKDLGPLARGFRRILLPLGRVALAPSCVLAPLGKVSSSGSRRAILDTARMFLGEPYFWGGMAASRGPGRGFDCSGLVSVAYRAAGLKVPRNAHDQWQEAEPVRSPRPGDLAFLSAEGDPEKVDHVMIYAGKGRVLEAEGAADRVREVALADKLGLGVRGAPSARIPAAGDYGLRRLSYGTFL